MIKTVMAGIVFLITLMSSMAFANTTLSSINAILANKLHATERAPITQIRQTHSFEASNVGAIPVSSAVQALRSHYRFVLFYRSSCPHCQRFDPTLKQFSDASGILVTAFTTDGRALPSFRNSHAISPQTISTYFGQGAEIKVPTLFLLNTVNKHAYPVSTGELSYIELAHRMNTLAPKVLAYDQHSHGGHS